MVIDLASSAVMVAARMTGSAAEDPGFLGRELLVGEDALVAEGGKVFELLDRIGRGSCRRSGGLVDGLRFGIRGLGLAVGIVPLLLPALGLPARDPVTDGGGGAGHDGGAGDPAKQSRHDEAPLRTS